MVWLQLWPLAISLLNSPPLLLLLLLLFPILSLSLALFCLSLLSLVPVSHSFFFIRRNLFVPPFLSLGLGQIRVAALAALLMRWEGDEYDEFGQEMGAQLEKGKG